MNTASRPARYSRTEIAQRVRGALAEKLHCDLAAAPESATLRGAGGLGMHAVDILELVGQLERSLGDLRDVRLVAFDLGATVGRLIDLVEGALGGIRS